MKGEPIDEALIGQKVAAHGLDWLYRSETGSTNADVLDYYREHRREVVAFSELQKAGRGRRGRQWHSPVARNIYCTVGLQKALPAKQQGLLSIVTGIALCRALRRNAGAAIDLKWPNDLLAGERKLGGILIESRPHDGESFFFAIGFGLNLFMREDELSAFGQPATSLDRVVAGELDRGEILATLIDAVIAEIRAFDPLQAQSLVEEYAEFDAFHGREVEVTSGGQRIRGINRGIAAGGQLQLETEQGLQLHSAAEISLRAAAE
jgi:BirA family biotin operon repressor/biotin-[acetyl-CoA-carboxylase] ligase